MSTTATNVLNNAGRVQDSFDPRDHYYAPDPTTEPKKVVNLREDDAQFTSDIYDQLRTGTCTANATAAALWYEEKAGRHEEIFGSYGPSRLFIYWLARGAYKNDSCDLKWPRDGGSCVRDAMRGIATCGACTEADWPFDVNHINTKPPQTAFDLAARSKINYFYRLDPDRPTNDKDHLSTAQKDALGATVLENLKKCLTEQYPVVFGFWYYMHPAEAYDQEHKPAVLRDVWAEKGFPRHCFPDQLPEDLKLRNDYGDVVSPGHTVLAIGYDEDRRQVLIQNSRGSSWGGNGTFWMPYSWITDYAATNDFWTIRADAINGAKKWEEAHEEALGRLPG